MSDWQSVWDMAEVLDQELQLQTGEADVTRATNASIFAKDLFDAELAKHPGLLGDAIGTVTTSANTEATTFPSGLLRLDALWFIDPSTSRPLYRLDPIYEAGGHGRNLYPPILATSVSATGRPIAYTTDGTNIRWTPTPDATHTIRYYGYAGQSDPSDGTTTFPYPDIVRPHMATMIAKLFQLGLGDSTQDYELLAAQTFAPAVDALSNFRRTGARPATTRYAANH